MCVLLHCSLLTAVPPVERLKPLRTACYSEPVPVCVKDAESGYFRLELVESINISDKCISKTCLAP